MKLFSIISLILLTSCTVASQATSVSSENTQATVMITNLTRNSGGSGVVLQSSETLSHVLTNAHVCGVVKNGGLVSGTTGRSGFVISYAISKTHDLCLIEVAADLGASTKIAANAPQPYDEATISGHPHLLPNIVTKGHFSGKQVIQVMIGSRPCTLEESQNSDTGLFCALIGRLPVVRSYEAIVVSATIQPGSSGSGIFNSNHELSALVFAGAGDLGYAFAVPHEYISFFLAHELSSLEVQVPNLNYGETEEASSHKSKFKEACAKAQTIAQKNTCSAIGNNTLF